MNILHNLTIILTLTIQNITYIGFMIYLSEHSLKRLTSPKFLVSFCIYSVVLHYLQKHDNNQLMFAFLLMFAFYSLMIFINTRCTISQAINISIAGYFIVSCCQAVVMLALALLNLNFDENNAADPILTAILILSLFVLIILNKLFPITKFTDSFKNFSYFSSLFFLGSFILVAIFISIKSSLSLGTLISTTANILFAAVITILIILQSFNDMKRKQSLKDYSTYMPIVDEMIENIQKRQHLYNNQLLSLSQLTDSYDNYEDLCKAIKDITQIDDRHRYSYDFLHLNNKLLAGLLFSKVNAALKKDIQIIVTIFNYDYTSNCSDMEIIDLAGVLIDNAIEACSPDDTIFISIGQRTDNIQSDSFRIKVENPGPAATSEFIHDIFTKKYTSKTEKDGHGLGLSIVKGIVKKYNGQISVENATHTETSDIRYLSIEVEI